MRLLRSWCGRRAELRRYQKDPVLIWIERHRARAAFGGDILDNAEFVS